MLTQGNGKPPNDFEIPTSKLPRSEFRGDYELSKPSISDNKHLFSEVDRNYNGKQRNYHIRNSMD